MNIEEEKDLDNMRLGNVVPNSEAIIGYTLTDQKEVVGRFNRLLMDPSIISFLRRDSIQLSCKAMEPEHAALLRIFFNESNGWSIQLKQSSHFTHCEKVGIGDHIWVDIVPVAAPKKTLWQKIRGWFNAKKTTT